jgi:CAAX prenyl protease-like protein
MKALLERHPWVPWVAPFAVFLGFLGLRSAVPEGPWLATAWVGGVGAAILVLGRPALDLRVRYPLATLGVGVAVFLAWVGPDLVFPGYRQGALFQNALTGRVESSFPVAFRTDPAMLALRFARAALIVPIAEELFWRGWLPRWLDRMDDFRAVPLGGYTRFSFLGTAVLFAVEHGPYWDVGLVAGLAYNGWMARTRSLGDLIWCHAVTNACLSGWVFVVGQWQYW